MKTKLLFGLVMLAGLLGCEYKNLQPACYHGTVIMSNCCAASTFISIDSSVPLGKPMKWLDKEYSNVIQVPNYLNVTGDVYLTLRDFDPDKDQSLFPPIRCYCLIAVGTDVPMYVATSVSSQPCIGADNH